MIMKTLHFGIEMEMTGITRSRAASLMARFFRTESRHEGKPARRRSLRYLYRKG